MAETDAKLIDIAKLRRSCQMCSLRQLCLPAGIGAGDLEQLDRIVQRRRPVECEQRLFRAGDTVQAVYVARDGAFKTVTVTEDGSEQVVGFHLAGELIGLDGLGTGHYRCDAIALSTANVCEIPLDQLASVSNQLPRLQQQLLRVIGQSIGRDQDHLEMLSRRQATERMALFLHGLGERYRVIGQSPLEYRLPMSREDIANYLGLAIETVSRAFTRLQDDGVIEVRGRQLRIVDVDELGHLAHAAESPGGSRAARS